MNILTVTERCWPNKIVEPVLITYNRAEKLAMTLDAFLAANTEGMRLHVLDNASTDSTAETVARYRARWPELCYHRNKFNIGGNANFLRALEISDSEYCWVIGDDDKWYLDDLSELISVLNASHADVIRLGWLVSAEERGKLLPFSTLTHQENLFFASVSMISSVIVKRTLITEFLPESYLNVGDAYPQLVPFFKNAQTTSLSVYSVQKDIMTHTPSLEAGYFLSDLEWIACYCRSSRFLEDSSLRDKVVRELMVYLRSNFPGYPRWISDLRILLFFALKSKAYGFDQVPYLFTMFGYARSLRSVVFCTAIVYMLTPRWLIRILVRRARARAGLTPDLESVREVFMAGRQKRL